MEVDYRDTYEHAAVQGVHPNLFAAIDASSIGGSGLAENIKAIIQHQGNEIRACNDKRIPV
jgi:hypothetical protein